MCLCPGLARPLPRPHSLGASPWGVVLRVSGTRLAPWSHGLEARPSQRRFESIGKGCGHGCGRGKDAACKGEAGVWCHGVRRPGRG